jgi:hypothetical protein
MGSPIRKGSEVSCGEFLGVIADFPGSSYDHVHIGVESGNIRQFLNDDGSLKCTNGLDITGLQINPEILGGAALGGAALGGVASLGSQVDSTENPEEFEYAGGIRKSQDSDFEYAGRKQRNPVKESYLDENIDKKILKIYIPILIIKIFSNLKFLKLFSKKNIYNLMNQKIIYNYNKLIKNKIYLSRIEDFK